MSETRRVRRKPVIASSEVQSAHAHHFFAFAVARKYFPALAGSLLLGGVAHGALLTVDDKSDPGTPGDKNCTLREAITSVNAGVADPDCPNKAGDPLGTNDAIHLDPGLAGQEILLNGSALVITSSVEVLGPAPGTPKDFIIDAGKLSRVVEVTGNDIDVILDSLTLGNGDTSDSGGAVLMDSPSNESELTLVNCIVTNSEADGGGGGVHVSFLDSVTIRDSVVGNNVAGMKGGAVSVSLATLSVINSTIASNDAGDGGAIYALLGNTPSPVSVSISNSTIQNNRGPSNTAGGVFVFGGASTLSISDSLIRNNDGSGISTGNTELLLTRTIVSGHIDASSGAGVRASGSDVTISESTISGNTATGNGGGILISGGELTLEGSMISGNGSGNAGGGLILTGPSPMQITRSTISGNTAVLGGGISTSNDVTVSYSTISGNSAGLRGGGVAVGDNQVLALMFSTLNNNSAGSGGSNLYARLTGGTQITSALIVNGQGSANCDTDTLPTVLAPSLSDDASCIGFIEDASAGSRLGVLTDNGGPTLTHALFQGNPAIDGAAMSCASTDQRGFNKPVDGDNDGGAQCDIGAVEFIDTDFDGVIDFYESANGLDPNDANDPNGGGDDLDGDGVTNQDEFEGNLEADNPDTDGDVLGDGIDNDPLNASNACVQDGLGDAEFDMTAMSGLVTQCAAENSITVRAIAVIENGAELELYSPNVRFDPGVSAPVGAQVEVNAVNPMLAP